MTREISIIALFAIPFIIVGAIASHFILLLSKGRYGIFINIAVGLVLAALVSLLWFDGGFSGFIFISIICIIGSSLNFLGWRVQNKKVQYGLVAIIPVVLIAIFLFVFLWADK